VEVQAHFDGIELTAHKGVKVISITDVIEMAGKREVLLTSGGAYIRIKDGDIEIHAPGTIDVKGAQRAFGGPTSLYERYKLEGKKGNLRIRYVDADGNVPEGEPIKLVSEDGATHHVALDGKGIGELKGIDFGRFVASQVKRIGEQS
jgi:type VI secretion system secreted protein VgrG